MAIPLIVPDLDSVPDDQKALYKADGDHFRLDLDQEVPDVSGLKSALEAERANAKTAKQQLAELARRTKVVDELGGEDKLKELSELQKKLEQDDEYKLFTSGNREEYNKRIVGRVQQDLEKRLSVAAENAEKLQQQLQATQNRLSHQMIGGQIKDAASKMSDIFPEALATIEHLGHGVFTINERQEVEARERDGSVALGADGKPLAIADWVKGLRESHPFFFRSPSGGSAQSSSAGGRTLTEEAINTMSQQEYQKLRQEGKIR